MAFTLDPQTGKITFGVVADLTHDAIARDIASEFGVSETFNDDFNTNDWTSSNTARLDIDDLVDEEADFNANNISTTDNSTQFFDLNPILGTTVNDTNWILRFKLDVNTVTQGVDATPQNFFIGLSDSTADATVTQDWIGLTLLIDSSSIIYRARAVDGAVISGGGTNFTRPLQVETIFIEIVRSSSTSVTIRMFSDESYTVLLEEVILVISANIVNLRHLKMVTQNTDGTADHIITGHIDDLQFWDGITVPVITSTNWRMRYTLDITALSLPSGSDLSMWVGMMSEDETSDSNNAQDGFQLGVFVDNTLNRFVVGTPDNQPPRSAGVDKTMTTQPSVNTFFVEMIRDSASQTTVRFYTDNTYTSISETQTQAGISGSDSLKYLKLFNDVLGNNANTMDGTFDDFTFTDLSVAGQVDETFLVDAQLVPSITVVDEEFLVDVILVNRIDEEFFVDAIVATIAEGNHLTWQFREHRRFGLFFARISPQKEVASPNRLQINANSSSRAHGHTFKVFKKSEVTGSDLIVKLQRTQGSNETFIEVLDGAYDANSVTDFVPQGGRAVKGAGILGSAEIKAPAGDIALTLPASSINYAGSTEDEITVFVLHNDNDTGGGGFTNITTLQFGGGLWRWDNALTITFVQDTTDGSPEPVGSGGRVWYINAGSVVPAKQFGIDAFIKQLGENGSCNVSGTTVSDDFSSDNFTHVGTNSVSGGVLNWEGARNGTSNISNRPITAPANNKMLYRTKLTISNFTAPSSGVHRLMVGLARADESTSGTGLDDFMGFRIEADSGGTDVFRFIATNNQNPSTSGIEYTFTTVPSVGTFFLEFQRFTTTTAKATIYSEATYNDVIETSGVQTVTQGSGITGLENAKIMNDDGTALTGGALDGTQDDLDVWSGVTTPQSGSVGCFEIDASLLRRPDEEFTVNALVKALGENGGCDTIILGLPFGSRSEQDSTFAPGIGGGTSFGEGAGIRFTPSVTLKVRAIEWNSTKGGGFQSGQVRCSVYTGVPTSGNITLGSVTKLLGQSVGQTDDNHGANEGALSQFITFWATGSQKRRNEFLNVPASTNPSGIGGFLELTSGTEYVFMLQERDVGTSWTVSDTTGGNSNQTVPNVTGVRMEHWNNVINPSTSEVLDLSPDDFAIDFEIETNKSAGCAEVDSIVKAFDTNKEFTVDCIAFVPPAKLFLIQGITLGTIEKEFLIDACLQSSPFTTFKADACIQQNNNEGTFTIDGLAFDFPVRLFLVDSIVRYAQGTTTGGGIPDLIIRVLRENGTLTGRQIVEEINIITSDPAEGFSFVGKTSRIKNWLTRLTLDNLIQEDGSDPDWYETNWSLV